MLTIIIIKSNEYLLRVKSKTRFDHYYPNINMETIFMNTKNSKTIELHKFVLNLSQTLELRS